MPPPADERIGFFPAARPLFSQTCGIPSQFSHSWKREQSIASLGTRHGVCIRRYNELLPAEIYRIKLEARDRLRAKNDYQVNLKAELEIRHLHEKLVVLLKHQWQKLLEIQQIQMDFMKELMRRDQPDQKAVK